MKKETLEEAAKRIYPKDGYFDEIYCDIGDYDRGKWIEGAKWQQERSYSEEEVLILLMDFRDNIPNDVYVVDWFEKFKKK